MMFQLDTAFAVESIALVAGTFLLAWMSKAEVKCAFSKFVGVFVIVVSLLGMSCSLYYGLLYRSWGLFNDPHKVMSIQGVAPMKMEGCSMMEQMMKGMDAPESQTMQTSPKEHELHHPQ